jgi:ribonuclease P/MRP protein subunit POP5
MEKIKPLLPSLREKKRYIAFEILSDSIFSFKEASDAVFSTALSYSGVKGLADMGLIVLKEKYSKNKGVLRVSSKKVNSLKSSFCLCSNIEEKPFLLRSLGVSGILHKMDKFIGLKEGV